MLNENTSAIIIIYKKKFNIIILQQCILHLFSQK